MLFDRSWYNRAGVEHVMGFCTDDEYREFLRSCPEFEEMLIRSGIVLVKYWFSVSDDEQERRFQARIDDPEKRWKLSPMDLEARARWADYSRAKDEMFRYTDTKLSPWWVVERRRQAARAPQLHQPPAVAGPVRRRHVGAAEPAAARTRQLRAPADRRADLRARGVLSLFSSRASRRGDGTTDPTILRGAASHRRRAPAARGSVPARR